MPYVNEEGGRLNNYAKEPQVYKAEPPSSTDKRNYLILGVFAVSLIVGVVSIAFVVS